jgi:hypothetical protein
MKTIARKKKQKFVEALVLSIVMHSVAIQ